MARKHGTGRAGVGPGDHAGAEVRSGLTLVEVVIVVAIIAILAGVLVPPLRRALALTRQVVCLGQLRSQSQAHAMYAITWQDRKPPMMVTGRRTTRVDWVSPRLRWSGRSVGQGVLVEQDLLPLKMLYCPSASMDRDRELDQKAWQNLPDAGSSFAYFWRHPSGVRWSNAPGYAATFQAAMEEDRPALSMDINCEEGHNYTGDYQERHWPSHPLLERVNVAYIGCYARSIDSGQVRLKYPGGPQEELAWFDKAHGRGKEAAGSNKAPRVARAAGLDGRQRSPRREEAGGSSLVARPPSRPLWHLQGAVY